ncbi:TniB family NTP-binding protein [Marinicellulosiphila megalodicopiae]|uniref:TniB family NTP-binding protein n=1 Tax=Marinicellulosiphila megalodicopiae TaxID=2724896 RepID=UPI003BB19E05
MNNKFILTPGVSRVIKSLEYLKDSDYIESGDCNMVLTGETGSGKSALITYFKNKYPPIIHQEFTEIPVVYVLLQSVKGVKEFSIETLKAIQDPQQGRKIRNIHELRERLKTLVKTCKTKIIVFDEVQVTVQNNRVDRLPTIADWFKDLMNDLKIPIVLVGMPWTIDFVESNSQLSSRISFRFNLSGYNVSENFTDFRKLLRQFSIDYCLFPEVDLSDKDLSLRLYSYTKGSMRSLSSLIAICVSKLSDKNKNKLMKLFALELRVKGVSDEKNNFLVGIKELEFFEIKQTTSWKFEEKPYKVKMVPPLYKKYKYIDGEFISYD